MAKLWKQIPEEEGEYLKRQSSRNKSGEYLSELSEKRKTKRKINNTLTFKINKSSFKKCRLVQCIEL